MSAERWTHHDPGVREIIARETAALTAENEALRARLAKVEAVAGEAWRVAALRRGEARRYYVAWQVARMRARKLHAALAEGGPR